MHSVALAQGDSLRAEFQKSSDDFRELLKMDLALLKNDERLLWEKERQAIREDEVLHLFTFYCSKIYIQSMVLAGHLFLLLIFENRGNSGNQ